MNLNELFARYHLAYQAELLFRILLSAFIGYLIGYERKNREKAPVCGLTPSSVWGQR